MDALAAMKRDARELVAWIDRKREQQEQARLSDGGESVEGYGAAGLIDDMLMDQERERDEDEDADEERNRHGDLVGEADSDLTAVPYEPARATQKQAVVTVSAVGS
jgi:hypothetical protein